MSPDPDATLESFWVLILSAVVFAAINYAWIAIVKLHKRLERIERELHVGTSEPVATESTSASGDSAPQS